jgi:hypothetical protein
MIKDDYAERVMIRRSFTRGELAEITAWLIQQTGNCEFWDDCHVEEPGDATMFYFKEQQLALLFKLRWDSGR